MSASHVPHKELRPMGGYEMPEDLAPLVQSLADDLDLLLKRHGATLEICAVSFPAGGGHAHMVTFHNPETCKVLVGEERQ